ncbi:forkhead-associated (FHA) domain-containing protein [Wolffia australiana]
MDEEMVAMVRVIKGGRTLKNIFLNEPPSEGNPNEENAEVKILVGRHPDCHLVVDHPSISRFHLQISVLASSRNISVLDLSSVHGTWISGNKLQPKIAAEISAGDTMRIGASSRIYEFDWIPLRNALELENPPAEKFEFEDGSNCAFESENPSFEQLEVDDGSNCSFETENISAEKHAISSPVHQLDDGSSSAFQTENTLPEKIVTSSPVYQLDDGSNSAFETKNPPAMLLEPVSQNHQFDDIVITGKNQIQKSPSPEEPNPILLLQTTHYQEQEEKQKPIRRELRKTQSVSVLRVHTGRSRDKSLNPPALNPPRDEDEDEENICKTLFRDPGMETEKKSNEDEEEFLSDKENCKPQATRSEEQDRKPRRKIKKMVERGGRVPFQPLMENPANMQSHNLAKEKVPIMEKSTGLLKSPRRRWIMIVDTSCFLDEESKKALRLLEGVRGTRLIVPRMVIRELDCVRRREGLFRRAKKVSPVLQWIEESMVKTSWWIHVQSSAEEVPTAMTPPAKTETEGAAPGLAEILSPTADDHILDCAFHFGRIKNDGQLVLLTNQVSLKIKAMAEGLLCETPTEFRESLMNPCSERFLWAESSPRGLTWSASDATLPTDGCRNHYSHRLSQNGNAAAVRWPAKGPAPRAEGARGLKLILLHHPHYAQPYP